MGNAYTRPTASGPRPVNGREATFGAEEKQRASFFRVPNWGQSQNAPRLKVATIYFDTGKADLDSGDMAALESLAKWYQEVLAVGGSVKLEFEGHADRRGKENFNMRLSKDRAQRVLGQVTLRLGRWPQFAGEAKSFGEVGAGDHLAEDRRVDIFQLTPWQDDEAGPPYTWEYLKENLQLLRLPIFERWHRDWESWKPLRHVLKNYEEKENLHGGSYASIPLNKADLDKMAVLLRKVAPSVMRVMDNQPLSQSRDDEVRTAFFVQYEQEFPKAHRAAELEYGNSGTKEPFQMYVAKKLGLLTAP